LHLGIVGGVLRHLLAKEHKARAAIPVWPSGARAACSVLKQAI